MRTVYIDDNTKGIAIGIRQENDYTTLVYTAPEDWADGVVEAFLRKPGESESVPLTGVEKDGLIITCSLTRTDLVTSGRADLEYMCTIDDTIVGKSPVFPCVIANDIISTSTDRPDEWQSWVDELVALGAVVRENAAAAAASAASASSSEASAGESAASAGQSAASASQSARSASGSAASASSSATSAGQSATSAASSATSAGQSAAAAATSASNAGQSETNAGQSASAASQSATSASQSASAASSSASAASSSASAAQRHASDAADSEAAAKLSEDNAKLSEEAAAESAEHAEQTAAQSGFMFFNINDAGHLIMRHTQSVDEVDFELVNGHLIMEVI